MRIISVTNRKGGVGKTATAHALGAGLMLRGYKVLFVDLDSQTNLSYTMGVNDPDASTMELLEGTASASSILIHTEQGDILPASEGLAVADTKIIETGKEYRLREALQPLKDDYDFIIIDTPPQLGVITVNALTASDGVIIPVQADILSLQGLTQISELFQVVKKYTNATIKNYGFVITRYNKRSVLSRDIYDTLNKQAEKFEGKILGVPIRECTAIKEAQAYRQSIFDYAPKSNASADYNELIDHFLAEVEN